jgi:hypothetical protein
VGERRARAAIAAALVGSSALVAVAAPSVALQTGCQLNTCQGTLHTPPRLPDGGLTGELLDEHTWESAPMQGDWADLKGNDTQQWDYHALGNQTVANVVVYLSSDRNWFDAGSNWTIATGNLAEVTSVTPPFTGAYEEGGLHPGDRLDLLSLTNATCSEGYYRVVITAFPPDAGP